MSSLEIKIWESIFEDRAKGLSLYAWRVWRGCEPSSTQHIKARSIKEAKAIAKEQKAREFGRAGRLEVWFVEVL